MSTELGGSSGNNDVMVTDKLSDSTLVSAPDRKTLTMRFQADGDVQVEVRGVGNYGFFTYDGNVTVVLDSPYEIGDDVAVHYKKT